MFSLLAVSILFAACKKDDDNVTVIQHRTITVVLNLPTEAAGKTAAIIFDRDSEPGNGYVKAYSETLSSGTNFSFDFNDIPAGTYYLIAVVFIVNTYGNEPGPGDYIGIYGTTSSNIPTHANATVPVSGTKTFSIDLVVMTKQTLINSNPFLLGSVSFFDHLEITPLKYPNSYFY